MRLTSSIRASPISYSWMLICQSWTGLAFIDAVGIRQCRLNERGLRGFAERMKQMLTPELVNGPPVERLVIKGGGTTRFLEASELECIEAAGMYVVLHSGGKEMLYRSSLNDLEVKLDPRHFIRIHRSAIVNLSRVAFLEPISHGEFQVVLKSGKRVRMSRTYRAPSTAIAVTT